MTDAILKSASDEISEGTALYLDGELTAVCSDGVSLQSYLSSLLEPYEDPENSNVTVGFNKEVTLTASRTKQMWSSSFPVCSSRKRSTQWAQATRYGASPRKTTSPSVSCAN